MTANEVVKRAKSALGHGTRYRLGQGGYHPFDPYPAANGFLDCSGFASWCLGLSRQQPETIEWIETSRIVKDAEGAQKLFRRVASALAGDLIVYGDAGRHEGHVGVITAAVNGVPTRVAHCNARTKPDAIVDEPASVFWFGALKNRGAIFARYIGLEAEEPMIRTRVTVEGVPYEGYFDTEKGLNYIPLAPIKPFLVAQKVTVEWKPDSHPPEVTIRLPSRET